MNTDTDQRAFERHSHCARIRFSYFNQAHYYEAQLCNYCDGGMCLRSKVALQPGASVFIRVLSSHADDAIGCDWGGLRSATLAEAKWCREVPYDADFFYEMGMKYFPPMY